MDRHRTILQLFSLWCCDSMNFYVSLNGGCNGKIRMTKDTTDVAFLLCVLFAYEPPGCYRYMFSHISHTQTSLYFYVFFSHDVLESPVTSGLPHIYHMGIAADLQIDEPSAHVLCNFVDEKMLCYSIYICVA